MSAEPVKPPFETQADAGGPRSVGRMPGATVPLADMDFPELLSYSARLGNLLDFPVASIFSGAGTLLVGAAAGAKLTGTGWGNPWLICAFLVGFVCWAAALAIGREKSESIDDIKAEFDFMLGQYLGDERLALLKEKHDAEVVNRPTRFERRIAKLKAKAKQTT